MYNINSIADYLVSESFGILGKDLFIYHSPPEIGECTILFPSNDPPIIDPDLPYYRKAKFQTIVRAKTYSGGLTKIQQLQDTLQLTNHDLPDILVKQLRPLHEARVYRRSLSGDIELSITFFIVYVQK